jgi:hypothetical protein
VGRSLAVIEGVEAISVEISLSGSAARCGEDPKL